MNWSGTRGVDGGRIVAANGWPPAGRIAELVATAMAPNAPIPVSEAEAIVFQMARAVLLELFPPPVPTAQRWWRGRRANKDAAVMVLAHRRTRERLVSAVDWMLPGAALAQQPEVSLGALVWELIVAHTTVASRTRGTMGEDDQLERDLVRLSLTRTAYEERINSLPDGLRWSDAFEIVPTAEQLIALFDNKHVSVPAAIADAAQGWVQAWRNYRAAEGSLSALRDIAAGGGPVDGSAWVTADRSRAEALAAIGGHVVSVDSLLVRRLIQVPFPAGVSVASRSVGQAMSELASVYVDWSADPAAPLWLDCAYQECCQSFTALLADLRRGLTRPRSTTRVVVPAGVPEVW